MLKPRIKMATISRRMHRFFGTCRPDRLPSIKALINDLYSEKNLEKVVEKFKTGSKSDIFRGKTNVYEHTVRRLAAANRFSSIDEILQYQKLFLNDISNEGFTIRLIKLYGESRMFENAKKMFDEMPHTSCKRTVKSVNSLLSAAVNCGRIDEMMEIFGEMEMKWKVKPDVYSYNIVVKGLCVMRMFDVALEVVNRMRGSGVNPDLITFNTLLYNLYKNNRFDDGEKMWKQIVENKLSPDIRSYNARILGLVNEKKVEEAGEFISGMEIQPDKFTYVPLVQAYCNVGDVEKVKTCYSELVRKKCVPDKMLLGNVLLCACVQGDYDWCFELCKELFGKKFVVDSSVLQKVVDQLVKNSRVEEANKVVQLGKSNGYCFNEL